MTTTMARILALAALTVSAPALAHDVEKGPNGGPLVTVKERHMELVMRGTEVVVYLTDIKHEPLSAAGATGRAVVQSGGDTKIVPLAAADANKLVGAAAAPLAAGSRVVVSATLPGGETLQARFVTK